MITWSHLWALPGHNAWLFLSTLLTCIILSWAALASARTSWIRYPPKRGRHHNEVVRGRRAWATVAVLASMSIWCIYRMDLLWSLGTAVSNRAILIEVLRALAALWLAIAWLIPTTSERD